MPITSYAPELLELFKRASLTPILIELGDAKAAIRLRFRMNQLRKELRKEAHPLANISNSVQFQVTSNGDLIAKPVDHSYLDVLKKAGIVATATPTSTPPQFPLVNEDGSIEYDGNEAIKKFLQEDGEGEKK